MTDRLGDFLSCRNFSDTARKPRLEPQPTLELDLDGSALAASVVNHVDILVGELSRC